MTHNLVWQVVVDDGNGHKGLEPFTTSFDPLNPDEVQTMEDYIQSLANAKWVQFNLITQSGDLAQYGDEAIQSLVEEEEARRKLEEGIINGETGKVPMLVTFLSTR